MASNQEEASAVAVSDQNLKKISELKVTDLKAELEKRGKDKNGVKQTLIERLTIALSEEGHDPSEYTFSMVETPSKGTAKRKTTTPVSKMSQKEKEESAHDREDSDNENSTPAAEVDATSVAIKQEDKVEAPKSQAVAKAKNESKPRRSGLEAADIVQDALQLDVDDELNEYRDNADHDDNHDGDTNNASNIEITKATEESLNADESRTRKEVKENGASPPVPETVIVPAPLTVEDTLALDTSLKRGDKTGTDDMSMVVNVDDTRSELDADLDTSQASVATEDKPEKPTKEATTKAVGKKPRSTSDAKKESVKEKQDSAKESTKETDTKASKGKTSSSANNKDGKSTTLKDKKTGSIPTRNIWVSNLSNDTRASDLQTLFKKHGKVIGAKIITNTKIPGARLYGLITMETAEQAEKCIQALNKTELNGKNIYVGKNRPVENARPMLIRKGDKPRDSRRKVDGDDRKERKSRSPRSRSGSPSRPFVRRLPMGARPFGIGIRRNFIGRLGPSTMGFRPHAAPIRRFEPDRSFRRERDFADRDRRQADFDRQDAERRAREERERLDREKEKLRIERERLEKEKAELMRMERERARQEREKIEREREEIAARRREAQLSTRIVDDIPRGRPTSTVATKRPFDTRESDPYWDDRKRPTAIASQVTLAPRAFDTGSNRFPTDFDNRNNHGSGSFDNRGGDSYLKRKIELNTFNAGRGGDYERRDSSRHSGHDRDDRRAGISTSNSSYSRDTRARPPSRDRERRSGVGGGRDDWKSHDSRGRGGSDRYESKGITGPAVYTNSTRSSFGGGNRGGMDWTNDRNQSTGDSYGGNLGDNRSRAPTGLSAALMAGGNSNIGSIFPNSAVPMAGMMSHGNAQAAGLSDRSYGFHSVGRRF